MYINIQYKPRRIDNICQSPNFQSIEGRNQKEKEKRCSPIFHLALPGGMIIVPNCKCNVNQAKQRHFFFKWYKV